MMGETSTQEQLRELGSRVADIEARLAGLRNDIDEVGAAVTTGYNGTSEATSSHAAVPEPVYDCVEDWVHDFYLPTFIRPIGGDIRWCGEWQEHREAVLRFEVMWRSWEVLRSDGGLGMSTWLLNHLEPNAATLLSCTGPFAQCTPGRHHAAVPLP